MPSRDDFVAARQAAFERANASEWLLNSARNVGSTPDKVRWIAKSLDMLCQALACGRRVITKVENELMMVAPDVAGGGGMTCPTAHHLCWEFAASLGGSIRKIDHRLVPSIDAALLVKPHFGNDVRFINSELVREHLPAIVAELSRRPPFAFLRIVALMERESAHAIDRLESARGEPARPDHRATSANAEVMRGPHGFTFTYSPSTLPDSQEPEVFDPSKHPEWVAWVEKLHRNRAETEQARLADPMPDPEALTVGEMIDFNTFLARTPMEWRGAIPIIGQQCNRRDVVLLASPGFKAFTRWANSELGRNPDPEAAEEFLSRLARRIHWTFEESRGMRLLDAVRVLDEPEAPASPAPPPSGIKPGTPEGDQPVDAGVSPAPPPREEEQAGPVASGSKAPPPSLSGLSQNAEGETMSRLPWYLALDGVTWINFDRDACPRRWFLFQQDWDDRGCPEEGIVQVMLFLTPGPEFRWVEVTWKYDPTEQKPDSYQYREVNEGYAIGKLNEIGASIPPEYIGQHPEPTALGSVNPFKGKDRVPEFATPLIILGTRGDEPIVNGIRKARLTSARYDIIKTLLAAGENGLTGDELVNKSLHGGAVNTLKTLAKSDPDWGVVIQLAGGPGGRYRIASV